MTTLLITERLIAAFSGAGLHALHSVSADPCRWTQPLHPSVTAAHASPEHTSPVGVWYYTILNVLQKCRDKVKTAAEAGPYRCPIAEIRHMDRNITYKRAKKSIWQSLHWVHKGRRFVEIILGREKGQEWAPYITEVTAAQWKGRPSTELADLWQLYSEDPSHTVKVAHSSFECWMSTVWHPLLCYMGYFLLLTVYALYPQGFNKLKNQ